MIDLTGKTALVTGGSRGVGRAVAMLLAKAGADLIITYHTQKNAAEQTLQLIREQGRLGYTEQVDMENDSDIATLFAKTNQIFPDGLDFFIANAGIWPVENVPITEMSTAQWRRTLTVNLDAVFYATRAAGKYLRDNGRIVYVTSTAAQRGESFHGDYAASKGALNSLVKGLCIEFAPRNITVNAVAPGWIDTEMSWPAFEKHSRAQIEKSIPLGRIASAEDVAGPIVFLCSELARHITGEIVNVNGGAVLCG